MAMQIIYADAFLVFTALAIVKVSILLFYKRVFPLQGFFLAANIMIGITIAWFTGSIFVGNLAIRNERVLIDAGLVI